MHGPGTQEFVDFCLTRGWVYIRDPWNNTIWHQGSPTANLEYINQLKQNNQRPIVDMSIEHWGGKESGCVESTYSILEQNFSEFVLLTHNANDHKTKENLFFYPYWYHRTRKYYCPDPVNNLSQQFFVSCLNGALRFQRIANWVILSEKSYNNKVFKKIITGGGLVSRPDDYKIDESILQKWHKLMPTTADNQDDFYYDIWNHRTDNSHHAYTDSYVNLVTETSVLPEVFVTEKTWKAVASGQFFVIFGSPFVVDHLRDLGVDTFDDIINHNHYDHVTDWHTRLHKIHELLDDLADQDLKSAWIDTYNRRLANQQKFQNGKFDADYQQQLLNRLSQ